MDIDTFGGNSIVDTILLFDQVLTLENEWLMYFGFRPDR
ncbi:hypothetical protein DSUL_100079 [Desulfovibrionales bacterium]